MRITQDVANTLSIFRIQQYSENCRMTKLNDQIVCMLIKIRSHSNILHLINLYTYMLLDYKCNDMIAHI